MNEKKQKSSIVTFFDSLCCSSVASNISFMLMLFLYVVLAVSGRKVNDIVRFSLHLHQELGRGFCFIEISQHQRKI